MGKDEDKDEEEDEEENEEKVSIVEMMICGGKMLLS